MTTLAARNTFCLLLAAIGLCACSSLPAVVQPPLLEQPNSDKSLGQTQVIQAKGIMSAAGGVEKIRDVQDEGKAQLLAHHANMLGQLGESITADNQIKLLVDGPATFAAMFSDLDKARTSIQMESYIFEDAALGVKIADVLKRKAAEGLQVRLIYDAVGSMSTPNEFFDDLVKGGVSICKFNPVNPWFFTKAIRLNNRDHRKILIIDSSVAFAGGINISGVYSAGSSSFLRSKPSTEPDQTSADGTPEKGWRDTHIRVQGPAVADFSALYSDTWQRQGCDNPPTPIARQTTASKGDRLITVIGSKPGDPEPRIYRTLLTAIGGAKRSVHLTMSYFVPDQQTVDFLSKAAQRGVDVKLVLQGKSDTLLVQRAGQSSYQALLDAGVEIYERQDTLLHAKTAVIDGVWSTVGSSNVDWRSFLHNDEVSAIVLGADFGTEMEKLFQTDLAHAKRITPEAWAERGLGRRVMEWIGQIFEYWL